MSPGFEWDGVRFMRPPALTDNDNRSPIGWVLPSALTGEVYGMRHPVKVQQRTVYEPWVRVERLTVYAPARFDRQRQSVPLGWVLPSGLTGEVYGMRDPDEVEQRTVYEPWV